LIGTILWTIADLIFPKQLYTSKGLSATSKVMLAAIVVQIILGAFVAGLKAGFSYNTYPLMNGELFPSHVTQGLELVGLLENGPTVQFIHRWVAIVVFLVVLYFWYKHKQAPVSKAILVLTNLLLITVMAQVGLGIVTLVLAVPVSLGVLHQVVAVILFSVSVLLLHQLRYKPAIV
jgi:cytochrome c oxidase assembly protein subunit 15